MVGDLKEIMDFVIFRAGQNEIKIYSVLTVLLIFIITKILILLTRKGLFRKRKSGKYDHSNAYSLYQIIRYAMWVISIIIILHTLGISLTVLVAGSAALLVGVGLGLQQTFNDFISGLILLIEGSTKIGDVLQIDGDVVIIQKIGLRTSKGLNRDDIIVIIPNSLITTNKVINWSHQSKKTRFMINVGVAYGSDVELVSRVLKESALEHPDVTDRDSLEVRLLDFGSSALEFQVLFFSDNVFRIEKVKSDIRKIINRKFSENNITIPFTQIDLRLNNLNHSK
ncbi:MAG: mechanosensitive ion channel domain-containing protein [Bacteroidota bacterium]